MNPPPFFASATLVVILLLAACGSSDAPDNSASSSGIDAQRGAIPGVLRKSNGAEPKTLDPHRMEGVTADNILRDLFEGLVGMAGDGSPIPAAAKSWDVSEDGLTYTFHLREDGRWSNGDTVTADHFVFSLRRSVDPQTLSHYSLMLAPIEGAEAVVGLSGKPEDIAVRAVDALTLEIKLRAPTPYFLGLLTHPTLFPVHPDSLVEHGDHFTRPGNLVSNGGYQLTEWEVQSHIRIDRNSHYWDNQNTQINSVFFYPIEDAEAALKRYRADELDWNDALPVGRCDWVKENYPDDFKTHPYLGTYYYGLNTSRGPLVNRDLRMALNLSIDRSVITDQILGCGQIPAYGWIPPNVNGYEQVVPEYATWTQAERDAEAARLYAKAGFSAENPAEFEILYNTSEGHKKVALVISAMWKAKLGVDITLTNQEWKVYLSTRKDSSKVDMFRAGWIGDYNDAYTFAELLLSNSGMHNTEYSNPEYDRLVNAAAIELDPAVRLQMLQQAETILLADAPIIPIYFYTNSKMIKPWVQGFQGNILDKQYTRNMSIDTP